MTGVGEEGEGAGGGRRREQRLGVISAAVFTRRSTAAGVQVQLQVRAGGRQRYFRECAGFSSLQTDSRAGRTYSWAALRLPWLACGCVCCGRVLIAGETESMCYYL